MMEKKQGPGHSSAAFAPISRNHRTCIRSSPSRHFPFSPSSSLPPYIATFFAKYFRLGFTYSLGRPRLRSAFGTHWADRSSEPLENPQDVQTAISWSQKRTSKEATIIATKVVDPVGLPMIVSHASAATLLLVHDASNPAIR